MWRCHNRLRWITWHCWYLREATLPTGFLALLVMGQSVSFHTIQSLVLTDLTSYSFIPELKNRDRRIQFLHHHHYHHHQWASDKCRTSITDSPYHRFHGTMGTNSGWWRVIVDAGDRPGTRRPNDRALFGTRFCFFLFVITSIVTNH